MKRNLIAIALFIFAGINFAVAVPKAGADTVHAAPRAVATALEHLTVLEYDEPVVQAAIGSSVFQVERQDNKVFIKPLKANASTNLFVWTASGQQYSYELSVADVTNMDAVIHVANPVPVAAPNLGMSADQLAARAVSRTLLRMERVDNSGVKPPKDGIGLRIEAVFRDGDSLLIRYSLENRSKKGYQVKEPSFYQLRAEHSNIRLVSFKGKQLDQHTVAKLGETSRISVACSHDPQKTELEPGATSQGLISIRQTSGSSPILVQLVFEENVKATAVL